MRVKKAIPLKGSTNIETISWWIIEFYMHRDKYISPEKVQKKASMIVVGKVTHFRSVKSKNKKENLGKA
jgi:hypothetical protein